MIIQMFARYLVFLGLEEPNSIMMRHALLAVALLILLSTANAQNYQTLADGNWTTPANWNNTSGWGTSTPSITGGHGSGTATVNHDMTINADYSLASGTLLVTAGNSVVVNGNMTKGGGGAINVYGTLLITGNLTLNSVLNIYPGGQVIVQGNITVNSANYLIVGTTSAAPPYADLIVYQNVISQTSGDVTVNQNGRVAIFGDVTAAGGGTVFRINNGGQVYIDVDINFSGGGSDIINNNNTNPYGLYVNGTITNSGGGSGTTGNNADLETMENTNPPFYSWVESIPASPLPVELMYVTAKIVDGVIQLNWATASEINFDYFEIEYSTNGVSFQSIGIVQGAVGDSYKKRTYQFNHVTPVVGNNYYRLKSVDLDHSFTYSKKIAVLFDEQPQVLIYPNPARRVFNIRTNFAPGENDRIRVVNSQGFPVATVVGEGAETSIVIPDTWKPGVYFVQLVGTVTANFRLVIL